MFFYVQFYVVTSTERRLLVPPHPHQLHQLHQPGSDPCYLGPSAPSELHLQLIPTLVCTLLLPAVYFESWQHFKLILDQFQAQILPKKEEIILLYLLFGVQYFNFHLCFLCSRRCASRVSHT